MTSSLLNKFNISKKNILGHKEVSGAKTLCPGSFFPLQIIKNEFHKTNMLYKVQAGAFKKLENAKKLQESLKKHGFDSFIIEKKYTK
jgi:N-acetyl-anhydromuramyl-L-alanine amidase AmpD